MPFRERTWNVTSERARGDAEGASRLLRAHAFISRTCLPSLLLYFVSRRLSRHTTTMIPPLSIRLSTNVVRVARSYAGASPRCIHKTSYALQGGTEQPGRDPRLSQGSVGMHKNLHRGDVQDQAARAGQSNADKSPLDAASERRGMKANFDGYSGNPEGVGFADQVGGASAMGGSGGQRVGEGSHGEEEATPPGFFDTMKSALGFETTSVEVKQNRGGGEGVTGTGTFWGLKGEQKRNKRAFHTSARTAAGVDRTTTGQAPNASRQSKDSTYSEQNEHLEHREDTDSLRGAMQLRVQVCHHMRYVLTIVSL